VFIKKLIFIQLASIFLPWNPTIFSLHYKLALDCALCHPNPVHTFMPHS
jgi:hypothetical protein